MAKIQKFEDAGAIYTEDLTINHDPSTIIMESSRHVAPQIGDTPFGKNIGLRVGSSPPYGPISMGIINKTSDKVANINNTQVYTILFKHTIKAITTDIVYYVIGHDEVGITYSGVELQIQGDIIKMDIRDTDVLTVGIPDCTIGSSYSIVCRLDGTDIKIYVDSVEVASKPITYSPYISKNEMRHMVDNYDDDGTDEVMVMASDVLIFDRALDICEIEAYHENRLIDYDLNMIHSYDFDNRKTLYNKGVLETGSGDIFGLTGLTLVETEIGTGINSEEDGIHIIEFDSPVLPTGDSKPFTCSTWIRLDDNTSTIQRLFSNVSLPNGEGQVQGFDCYIGTGKKLVFYHRTYVTGSNFWLPTVEDFPINKLTHVVVTWDGTVGTVDDHAARLYINAVQVASDIPEAANIHESVENLNMFSKYTSIETSEHLGGTVTNIKVFDKVLTQSEIKHLYTTELIGRN